MKPSDVYTVLKNIGASHLHHANTVPTSCTFLEQGGLLSRGYVERCKLVQTAQPASDDIDRKYGIWDRLFLDHVDIHYRAGRTKGANHYGPALFVFDLDLLLQLPEKSDVFVTKQNPVHWKNGQPDEERWYLAPDDLSQNISFGDFDKMLVIKTPTDRLDFPGKRVRIYLDDPQRKMMSGTDAYTHAKKRLEAAAAKGKITIAIEPHPCRDDCICVKKYAGWDAGYFDSRFA